jgi:hypothetical protein
MFSKNPVSGTLSVSCHTIIITHFTTEVNYYFFAYFRVSLVLGKKRPAGASYFFFFFGLAYRVFPGIEFGIISYLLLLIVFLLVA